MAVLGYSDVFRYIIPLTPAPRRWCKSHVGKGRVRVVQLAAPQQHQHRLSTINPSPSKGCTHETNILYHRHTFICLTSTVGLDSPALPLECRVCVCSSISHRFTIRRRYRPRALPEGDQAHAHARQSRFASRPNARFCHLTLFYTPGNSKRQKLRVHRLEPLDISLFLLPGVATLQLTRIERRGRGCGRD
jgi:hypothetical protein